MVPIITRGVHLSFMQMFYVPTHTFSTKFFSNFHNPDVYYSFVTRRFKKKRLYVNGVGEFRSALKVKHIRTVDTGYPELDTMWWSMEKIYNNMVQNAGEKLAFLPCIPSVIDYLPSKQRTYRLILSKLPGTLSTVDKEACRMSISISYFPLGYAVSKIGIFLGSTEYSIDPFDIINPLKFPEKFFKVVIKKGNRILLPDISVSNLVKLLMKKFIQELSGPEVEVDVRSFNRYSIVDLADNSRKINGKDDIELIFKFVESSFTSDIDALTINPGLRLRSLSGYKDSISVFGDKYGFISMPNSVDKSLRLLYRRYLRNIAMLVMVQKSLSTEAVAIENIRWRDQIKSRSFVNQVRKGFLGPVLIRPLSFMHYLQIHHSFDQAENLRRIYLSLRESMDTRRTINETEDKLNAYFQNIDEEVKISANNVHGMVSKVIELAKVVATR